jgi:hypothetical protein
MKGGGNMYIVFMGSMHKSAPPVAIDINSGNVVVQRGGFASAYVPLKLYHIDDLTTFSEVPESGSIKKHTFDKFTFDNSGRMLGAAHWTSDHQIAGWIYNFEGQQLKQFTGGRKRGPTGGALGGVGSVAFSPHGDFLALAGSIGDVFIIDVSSVMNLDNSTISLSE